MGWLFNKIRRMLFIYSRMMAQNLKIKLEYKADFVLMLFAGSFMQMLGILFLNILFSRIPDIQGWSLWEVLFVLSAIFFTEGVVSLLFEGMWSMSALVNTGEFDRFLLRPVSPVLQVISSNLGANGIGNIIVGIVIFVQALGKICIQWDLLHIFYLVLFILSAITIRTSISFAANSSAFWLKTISSSFPIMVHQLADLGKYPITIFSRSVQFIITFIIPYAFIGYFPAVYLFGKNPQIAWIGWLCPAVAAACVFVSRMIFYRGLKSYESPGN
jgi:ABC-2 type transport system permease protein